MSSAKRLQKELQEMRLVGSKSFVDIKVEDNNILLWTGMLIPDSAPYNKGAFRVEIAFPAEYPFKPPKVTFRTKIYHPNIDENGQVCLPLIAADQWKPATKVSQVIEALIGLVNSPEPDHPLRPELAEEFVKDRKKFMKNAEDFTKKNAEKRP